MLKQRAAHLRGISPYRLDCKKIRIYFNCLAEPNEASKVVIALFKLHCISNDVAFELDTPPGDLPSQPRYVQFHCNDKTEKEVLELISFVN